MIIISYVIALSTYIHTIVVVHTIFIRLHRRLFVVKDTIHVQLAGRSEYVTLTIDSFLRKNVPDTYNCNTYYVSYVETVFITILNTCKYLSQKSKHHQKMFYRQLLLLIKRQK